LIWIKPTTRFAKALKIDPQSAQQVEVMSNARLYHAAKSRPTTTWHLLTLSSVLLVGAIGCGDGRPTRVAVSGNVMIDGVPITRGSIKFVPEKGRPSSGDIGPDGRFTLTCYDGTDGALPGKHRVQVDANRGISDKKMEIFTPKRYADFRTSGLEVEISKPVDDLRIDLTWGNEKKGPYIESLYSGT
jgi:hypothetical protein